MAEGWRMWPITLLTILLLLPLLSAAPLDIAGDIETDNDGMHSHDENVTRDGKFFDHNQFDIRNINISGSVAGDVVSIGHKVEIDVHGHTQDHHHHKAESVIECKEGLSQLFKSIDANTDGQMDAEELLTVCRQNNIHITESLAVSILTLPDKTVGFNMAKFCELLKDCPSSNSADLINFLVQLFDKAVDGGWSNWTKYGQCSKSCGGGQQTRTRTCTDPVPQHKGRTCEQQNIGDPTETKDCNLHDCVCAADAVNLETCFCVNGDVENAQKGEACAAGQGCTFDGTCLNVCNHRPNSLLADCFCKNTNRRGVPCPRRSRCVYGVCHPPVAEHPCEFDDRLLDPPKPMPKGQERQESPYDTRDRFKWKDNIVPYFYGNENTKQQDEEFIRGVMDFVEKKTCFTFKPVTQVEYERKHCLEILIENVDCTIGYKGNVAKVPTRPRLRLSLNAHVTTSDGLDCGYTGLIIHELMHVLGVGHTQRRRDRNQYITVEFDNLKRDMWSQYQICQYCELYQEIPYDCGSIMHYGTHVGSMNYEPTIVPKDTTECKLHGDSLIYMLDDASDISAKDWELLNIIGYDECPGKKRKRSVQEIATVRGKIILPAGLKFTFPEDSRVHISCDDISKLPSTSLGSVVVDVSNKSSQEDITYEMEVDLSKSEDISMSSTINIGWKRDPIGDEWIRKGDFINDISHNLYVTQDTSEYQIDIAVVHYN